MPLTSGKSKVTKMAPPTASGAGPQSADKVGAMTGPSPASSRQITLVLADDHKVVRTGLRMLLESDEGFDVLEEAGDVAGTMQAVLERHPQVLVLDLNLGGESSLDVIPQLRAEVPQTQIVVLTMQEDPGFARAALRAGALGYVLKDAADAELMSAVRLAAEGRTYLNPQLGAKLASQPPEGDTRPDNLSPREVEVLQLIALGHTNGEIAELLALSVRTVESHRAHLQQKTQLATRAALVGYARDHDLLH